MRDKWLELNKPQRFLLCLQGAMILLFLILYCTVGRQQVIWYDGSPLRWDTDGESTTYSGKVDGQRAVFTVSPGPVVEYRLGDTLYGPYSILEDPTAVPQWEDTGLYMEGVTGVEVRSGSRLLFRGAYTDSGSSLTLFDENGALWVTLRASGSASDAAPGVYDILQIAVAPEIVTRGHLGGFGLGLFCIAACALSILFADALFRFWLSFHVRSPEDAEPSDWELFERWAGWICLTVLALVLFTVGLTAP